MTYNTTAIILRRETFRESDLSVSLLSREHGKIRAVAIGAKKIGSKLAGQLEPARELRLMLAPGKSFDKIGQAILVDNFNLKTGLPPRQASLERLYSAQKAGGLVDKLMPEHQKEAEVYDLLKEFLAGRKNYLFFSSRLLALTGHQPELQKCLVCKKPVESANNFFNFDRGGLVCAACGQKTVKEKQEEISQEMVEGWRKMSASREAEMPEEVGKKLQILIEDFITYRIL